MIASLLYLLAVAVVAWLVYWAVQQFGAPEPVQKVVTVAVVIIAVLACVWVLLGLTGGVPPLRP